MNQKKLSHIELMTATDVAMETMKLVEGVTSVNLLPPNFVIEPSIMGLGVVTASVSRKFADTNLNKGGKLFSDGSSIHAAYNEHIKGKTASAELENCSWQIKFQKVGGAFSHHYMGESLLVMGEMGWQIGFVEKANSIPELFAKLCSQANGDAVPFEMTQDFAIKTNSGFPWPIITFVIGGVLLFLFLGTASWIGLVVLAAVAIVFKYVINRDAPVQPTYKDDATIAAERSARVVAPEDTVLFKTGVKSAKAITEAKKQFEKVTTKVSGSDSYPCPICAESIKKAAKKCRFCGEWIG